MIRGWIRGEAEGFLSIEVTTTEISKNFTNWKVGRYRDSQGKLHEKDESFPIELKYILPEGEGVRYFKEIFVNEHEVLHDIYLKCLNKFQVNNEDKEAIRILNILIKLGISEEVRSK